MAFRMRWPTQYGKTTQEFGARPKFYGKFGLPGHEGIDFMAPEGSELYAVADGLVSDVRLDGNSDPNEKPYGNQVRIQHEDGYVSIYAHLAEVVVTRGQSVQAGQLIGLSGNTGNSFGAHLHFSLKKQGATQRGETKYPHDVVNPTAYLESFGSSKPTQPAPPAETTLDVQVESPEVGYLNVRSAPYAGSDLVDRVDHGATLGALEEASLARDKVGENGQWLWVRTPSGKTGYVAAWYLKLPPGEPAPTTEVKVTFVVVESPEVPLKLRSGPGVGHAQISQMAHGSVLKSLESPGDTRRKIGKQGRWLQIQVPNGKTGYTAAWYLKLQKAAAPAIPKPATGEPAKYVQVASPEFGLKVRGGPGTTHEQVWWIPHGTVLESLEDKNTTGRKVGQQGEWLHIRTPALWEGYIAAWYLKVPDGEDRRQSGTEVDLPTGLSPHIQGMHAATLGDDPRTGGAIRGLFESRDKKGWIFFTEVCGQDPRGINLNNDVRNRLWDWASQGYGVIVRLNNGYEPSGTLPKSKHYDSFAAAAARWAELYLKRPELSQMEYTWTIQIANEQNNPREHPGGLDRPSEHITPERYAEAFNKTYAQIKAVLPNSIVCTGAVDPYNYMPWRKQSEGPPPYSPIQYYEKMLANIDALDGIILHAYLHGPDPGRVTGLDRFGNGAGPLGDHYFDFQIYRFFMERIPGKWKDVPVYITEMNHICRARAAPECSDPKAMGWSKKNRGIVREIFKELNRWNQTPYAQQIRCGLLYRWSGDAWAIEDRQGVQEDFQQTLEQDYRWRTTPSADVAFSFAAPGAEEEQAPDLDERRIVKPDNLKRIRGIGRKAETVLNTLGIQIFEQLAQYTPEELRSLISETGLRIRHLETWPKQARLIAKGREDELSKIQTER